MKKYEISLILGQGNDGSAPKESVTFYSTFIGFY